MRCLSVWPPPPHAVTLRALSLRTNAIGAADSGVHLSVFAVSFCPLFFCLNFHFFFFFICLFVFQVWEMRSAVPFKESRLLCCYSTQ